MRSRDYSELRAFQAIAEHGSFAAAARQLRITPSALSQVIRRMEQTLGTRLFNRTTRSVSLTESGSRLYQRMRPAMAELDAALSEAKDPAGTSTGTVKIHSASMAATTFLAPILGSFYQQYPNIVLDIIVEDIVTDIVRAGCDVGITLGENIAKDMIAYPLGGHLQMVAAASPRYLEQHGTPQQPADLLQHSCINWRYRHEQAIYRWEFFDQGHWFSLPVDGPLLTTDRQLAVQAALQHVGIVFWTRDKLQPWIDRGELCPILESFCATFPGWHLYYPHQSQGLGAVQTFIQFMHAAYPR